MYYTSKVLDAALDIDNLFTIEELRSKIGMEFPLSTLKSTCTMMHKLRYLNKIDDKFIVNYKGTLQNLEKETERLLGASLD